jgi:hypothetical protein
MIIVEQEPYEYRVGGSLPEHAPSYTIRQADRDFYAGLKAGNFCYVFNSRQMGKTSLLVRTLCRLRSEGVACTTIDVSGRGSGNIQPEQWYAGIVYTLIKDFKLDNPLQFMKSWWKERDFLDPSQRLVEVIETILLPNTMSPIVIFIDEIDSILSLNFSTAEGIEANLQYSIHGTLERNRLKHDNTVTDVGYSPDGKFIASVSKDKTLKIWQVDGKLIQTIAHPESLHDLAISNDSQKIATVGDDAQVRVWNIHGEQLSPHLEEQNRTDKFIRVAINPDGKYIAAATNTDRQNAKVIIWGIESGKIIGSSLLGMLIET